jgi:glucan phosphoethanolaminetransferase (alkaline phosphatase superfamily)
MAQGGNHSQKRRIKKAVKSFLMGDVGPVFIKWVRRLLLCIWIFIVLIAAHNFMNQYEIIMSALPAGPERNTAIYQLVKDKAVTVFVAAVFFLIVAYGINPQSVFLQSQFGNFFQSTTFRIRRRDKKRQK